MTRSNALQSGGRFSRAYEGSYFGRSRVESAAATDAPRLNVQELEAKSAIRVLGKRRWRAKFHGKGNKMSRCR